MKTDLDTLATALYVTCDDLLIAHPEKAPFRPKVGITPKISDAEMVTLAVMQVLLGYDNETRRVRHIRAHLKSYFPTHPNKAAITNDYVNSQASWRG